MNHGCFEKLPQSDNPSLKWCSSHDAFTPRINFSKDRTKNDGLCYGCKDCRRKVAPGYNKVYLERKKSGVKLESNHGMTGTPEHETWLSIKSKRKEICKEWGDSFLKFYLWVGPKPSSNHVIHRENTKEGFKPGNTRWATRSESAVIRENNRDKGTSKNLVIKFRDLHCRFIERPALKVKKRIRIVSKNPYAKWCPACEKFLNKSLFGKDSSRNDKLAYRCRPCHNAAYRTFRAAWRIRKGIPKNIHLEHHGMCNTPEYRSWGSARTRTSNPNVKCWEQYGGRGITMCQEWQDSFMAFYRHIGPRPKGTSLDRIENDGNYEPGNVRWATLEQQTANKRKPRKRLTDVQRFTHKPLRKFLKEFREIHTGLSP